MAAITAATLEHPEKSTRMIVISGVIDFRSLKHTVRVVVPARIEIYSREETTSDFGFVLLSSLRIQYCVPVEHAAEKEKDATVQ
jgi:hypothetical protein